jgi:hypothetical protein
MIPLYPQPQRKISRKRYSLLCRLPDVAGVGVVAAVEDEVVVEDEEPVAPGRQLQ